MALGSQHVEMIESPYWGAIDTLHFHPGVRILLGIFMCRSLEAFDLVGHDSSPLVEAEILPDFLPALYTAFAGVFISNFSCPA